MQYGSTRGYRALLDTIAIMLAEEGIKVHPQAELVILDDLIEAEDILARLFLEKEDIVICHKGSLSGKDRAIYEYYGAKVIGLDLFTKEGLDRLEGFLKSKTIDPARLKFIHILSDTESGVTELSSDIRDRLISLAVEYNFFLFEDLRFREPLLSDEETLKAIDMPALESRVIQFRDLSLLFGKGVDLGCVYLALPKTLAVKIEAAKGSITLHSNSLAQVIAYKKILDEFGRQEGTFTQLSENEREPDLPVWLYDKLSYYGKKVKLSEIRRILKLIEVPKLISLAGGIPAKEFFPYGATDRLISGFTDEDWRIALARSSAEGLSILRQAIARYLNNRSIDKIVDLDEENIIITRGSQEGLDLLGWFIKKTSDERPGRSNVAITQKPTYLGFMSATEPYGCQVMPYDLNTKEGLDLLRGHLNQRQLSNEPLPSMIYVMPTFGNPNGDVMSLEVRQMLLDIADKFDIPIAEDDPYSSLKYEGEALPTLLELSKKFNKGKVLYLGTVSKTFTPGMRVGWTAGPKDIIDILIKHKDATTGGANSLTQLLTAKFMATGQIDRHVSDVLIAEYSQRRNAIMDALKKYMPQGTTWTEGKGGYFVWITLPGDVDAEKLLVKMTTEGIDGVKVGFVPGWPFLGDKNQLRLSFPTNPPHLIEKAIIALSNAITDAMANLTGEVLDTKGAEQLPTPISETTEIGSKIYTLQTIQKAL